jgi:NAD(P)H-nitrite reductase large subunit
VKIVIIGNGASGATAARFLRKLSSDVEITILSDESYLYYARPRLIDLLCDKISVPELELYKPDWYIENKIELRVNTHVQKIDCDNKQVITQEASYTYDKLLIATGAESNRPPIKGMDQPGIFTIRTIDDVLKVKKYISENLNKENLQAIFVGGGVLSLELAGCLVGDDCKLKVIDLYPYLMPKQLDQSKGTKLMSQLEEKGFQFYMEEICEEIVSRDGKLVICTKDQEHKKGQEIEGDLIIVSVGVHARKDLAENAGLKGDKGVVVNKYLQTSHPDIYAAGDCIQFEDKLWGFVKSSVEQGMVAANNMLEEGSKEYSGTDINVVLKVSGVDLKKL